MYQIAVFFVSAVDDTRTLPCNCRLNDHGTAPDLRAMPIEPVARRSVKDDEVRHLVVLPANLVRADLGLRDDA